MLSLTWSQGTQVLQQISKKKLALIEEEAGLGHWSPQYLRRGTGDTSASKDTQSQLSNSSSPRPVQQDFINESPPVPLQQSTNAYVSGRNISNSTYLINAISWDNSPLLQGLGLNFKRAALPKSTEVSSNLKSSLVKRPRSIGFPSLDKRAKVTTQCGPGQPCADGSCWTKGT